MLEEKIYVSTNEKPVTKNIPMISSKLRHHILRVPSVVRDASGIVINGHRIKSLVFTTDIAIIRNCNADAVLAMYHDQGLPVLKYQGFGRGVNITLGLPFIRTSVDHGTALELAGRGKADVGSFITALNLAIKMIVKTQ